MIPSPIEPDLFVQRQEFSVDSCAQESILGQLFEFFLEFAFSTPDDWGQDHHSFAFRQPKDVLDNLIYALASDCRATNMAMRYSNRREEQSHVVIDLGDCSYTGSRTA